MSLQLKRQCLKQSFSNDDGSLNGVATIALTQLQNLSENLSG